MGSRACMETRRKFPNLLGRFSNFLGDFQRGFPNLQGNQSKFQPNQEHEIGTLDVWFAKNSRESKILIYAVPLNFTKHLFFWPEKFHLGHQLQSSLQYWAQPLSTLRGLLRIKTKEMASSQITSSAFPKRPMFVKRARTQYQSQAPRRGTSFVTWTMAWNAQLKFAPKRPQGLDRVAKEPQVRLSSDFT